MFSHQYPCVRALWDKDLSPVWLPQIPSCNSFRSSFDTSGCMHSKYGIEKERLYNFWSSDNQNRRTFLRTLSASDFSLGKISSLRNYTIRSIQLGPTLIWWIRTISPFISVDLHKSLTRMTQGKPYVEEVARVARESACVFPFLRICSKLKDSNLDCKCLTWFKFSCILTSLASNFLFTWPTTNLNSRISPLPFCSFFEQWSSPPIEPHT